MQRVIARAGLDQNIAARRDVAIRQGGGEQPALDQDIGPHGARRQQRDVKTCSHIPFDHLEALAPQNAAGAQVNADSARGGLHIVLHPHLVGARIGGHCQVAACKKIGPEIHAVITGACGDDDVAAGNHILDDVDGDIAVACRPNEHIHPGKDPALLQKEGLVAVLVGRVQIHGDRALTGNQGVLRGARIIRDRHGTADIHHILTSTHLDGQVAACIHTPIGDEAVIAATGEERDVATGHKISRTRCGGDQRTGVRRVIGHICPLPDRRIGQQVELGEGRQIDRLRRKSVIGVDDRLPIELEAYQIATYHHNRLGRIKLQ